MKASGKEENMLIHFIDNFRVLGRVGDKIKINGTFPGIEENDYIFLKSEEDYLDGNTYRIEKIEYNTTEHSASFGAIVMPE